VHWRIIWTVYPQVKDFLSARRHLTRKKNPAIIRGMKALHDIFTVWPSYQAMAQDLGQASDTVRKWWLKRIPCEHWPATIEAAGRLGVTLTLDDLMRLNPPRKVRDPSTYRRKARKSTRRAKARKQAVLQQPTVSN
jgi:hypothetical protein